MTHWTSLYGHRDENTLVDVQSRMRRMTRATLFPGFSRLGQKLLSWRSSYASVSEDAAKQMRSAARNGSKDVGNSRDYSPNMLRIVSRGERRDLCSPPDRPCVEPSVTRVSCWLGLCVEFTSAVTQERGEVSPQIP